MVDDRNLSVHTYDEAIANHIFSNLGGYCDVLERWLAAMTQRAARP